MYLCGYYIDSTESRVVETILMEMKNAIVKAARESVKELVKTEATCIFDDITLNRIQRPEDISILDMAKGMVLKRINFAKQTGCATEYNFNVSACIMIYEDRTYIRIDAVNNIYVQALHGIDGLIPFHVFNEDALKKDALKADSRVSHAETWTKIKEKYEHNCMGHYVNFIFSDTELFDGQNFDDMKYASISERAEKLARHEVCARLIRMYSSNEQVPAFKTWEYMDWAIARLDNEVWTEEMDSIYNELSGILIEIDPDLVKKVRKDDNQETENSEECETED